MKSIKINFPEKMSAIERAMFLIEDCQIQSDSGGNDCLLTFTERKEIIAYAKKQNQLKEISQKGKMYSLSVFYMYKVESRFQFFQLKYSEFRKYLSTCLIIFQYELILHDIEKDSCKIKQDSIRNNYKKDFSVMDSHYEKIEINRGLQEYFLCCVESIKQYQKIIYQIEYLSQMAGFRITSALSQQIIDFQRKEIQAFIEQNELSEFVDKLLKNNFFHLGKNVDDKEFQHVLSQIKKTLELSEKDKETLQEKVKEDLINH